MNDLIPESEIVHGPQQYVRLEFAQRLISELAAANQALTDMKDDYLRRHKDACDCADELRAANRRAERAEQALQEIDHEVKDNDLSLGEDPSQSELAGDLMEAHRICDRVAGIIDAVISDAALKVQASGEAKS